MNIDNQIKLTAHQKMITYITRSMRCVILDLNENVLRFRAYFFEQPTPLEKDYINDALYETVMDFPNLKEGQNIIQQSNESILKLLGNGYLIFALAEEYDKCLPNDS